MLVNKITSLSSFANRPNNVKNQQKNYTTALNKASTQDSISFGLRAKIMQRFIPQDLIDSANKALKKFFIPGKNSPNVFFVELGKKRCIPVEISGKTHMVEAFIGRDLRGFELCMDLGKGKEARRYRLGIANGVMGPEKITEQSKFRMQKLGEEGYFNKFMSLTENKNYYKAASVIGKILEALSA